MVELHALTATQALGLLSAKEISSVELVRALERRIEACEGKVHAFTHRFLERALVEADEADRARRRGERDRPLLGLPISVKESIATQGVPVTLGVAARLGNVAAEDAVIVRALKAQGAIILGKTNVSQLLLFHEADNPIYGVTHNPWDLSRTPGGSSGGEAAAIASGMSLCGVGADIGGSIRIPAAFSGVFGLKPTVDRWSNRGSFTALMGQEVIRGQTGPLARSAQDLTLLMQAADGPLLSRWDPAVPPLSKVDPSQVALEGLRLGVVEDDGFLSPAASVRRAVEEAQALLERRGVKVIPFVPPDLSLVVDTYFGALGSDGGRTADELLRGDQVVAQLESLRRIAHLPGPVRRAVALTMGWTGERRVERLLRVISEKSVAEHWKLAARRTELRLRTFDAWAEQGLDAVLGPAHVTPALRHGDSSDFSLGGLPSMLYNFLNFPAGVAPVSRVRPDDRPRSDPRDRLEKKAAAVEEGSGGLPLGVQIAARPYREDIVLALLSALEEEASLRPDYPRTPVEP